ncbi:MAG: YraN family protein [Oscillospiraceae bacterium]|nr:YraN family protein [Oscillospiraceae bacterium]
MGKNNLTGAWGEAVAADYLRKKHYKIEAARYYSRFGEIDLIAKNAKYLVFAEVKLRKSDKFALAREYVNRSKQDRIRMTASIYLSQHPTTLQPRFDVIEIYAPEGVETAHPEILHMEDAFQ